MRVLAVSAEVISVKECKFPEHKGNAQAPDDLPVCGLAHRNMHAKDKPAQPICPPPPPASSISK